MIGGERMLRWLGVERLEGRDLGREFMASIVVFLVALPLCMGIAIASGVPPALGLITGIVGGLVVGFVQGSRLQVSGPAAGLAVIVWDLVQTWGLGGLAVMVLMAGAIQLVAGLLKMGQWFRAVSPAVIRGMLAGIGVLIFASQFHVMLDDRPRGNGLENLLTIPEAIYKGIFPVDGSVHHMAALVGIVTITTMILWNVFKPKKLKALPAALMGVITGSALAAIMGFPILFVEVPSDLLEAANFVWGDGEWSMLGQSGIWIGALTLAVVASAETLLCASAVDQLHSGPRTDYDQELRAQGLGNMICGVFGALPMTGVIVRSSANVDAGAKTRLSAIAHGLWLLIFVAALPVILEYIPTAALAAVLVYTGYKLLNPVAIREMWRFSKVETAIFAITLVGIVATDLLTGVLLGVAASLLRLAWRLAKLEVDVEPVEEEGAVVLHLQGFATFITLPKLARALEALPPGVEVRVELVKLAYIDHACIELMQSWARSREPMGNTLVLGWDDLFHRYHHGNDPRSLSIDDDSLAAEAA